LEFGSIPQPENVCFNRLRQPHKCVEIDTNICFNFLLLLFSFMLTLLFVKIISNTW
jgi:hypothetical protein